MAEPAEILAAARQILARDGSLAGKRVVITAGGTRESIDPVRVIFEPANETPRVRRHHAEHGRPQPN